MVATLSSSYVTGFVWYLVLFVVSATLLLVVTIKESSRKAPKYGLVLLQPVRLMLHLIVGSSFCRLLYAIILLLADLPSPRDDILAALTALNPNCMVTIVLLSGLCCFSLLLVLNAYVFTNNAVKQFVPLLPSKEKLAEEGGVRVADLNACVVSVWNGRWPAVLAKKLEGVPITLADTWMHPTNQYVIPNMVAEGVPEDSIHPVISEFTHMALPTDRFDMVLGALSLSSVSSPVDREHMFSEMSRILKPSGRICVLATYLDHNEAQSMMIKAGFSEIVKTTCWYTFFPLVLIQARKGKMNTNGAISIRVSEETALMLKEEGTMLDKHSSPVAKFAGLRIGLMALLACVIGGYAVLLVWLWPPLDIPSEIADGNRLTSGFLLPIACFFGVIWLQTRTAIAEHAHESTATKRTTVVYFVKHTVKAKAVSLLGNVIFWLPSMLIDLALSEHHVSGSISTVINVAVVATMVWVSLKIAKKMSARKSSK